MNHGPEISKWLELRGKTDRQLAALLHNMLASGLRLAREGADRDAPDLLVRAQKAYNEVRSLLPCLLDIAAAERRLLECELAHLGRLLDESTAVERAGAACS